MCSSLTMLACYVCVRQAKAVAALSCTVRGQHEAEEALLDSDQGLQVFHKCLVRAPPIQALYIAYHNMYSCI